jgi:hypothetical protein
MHLPDYKRALGHMVEKWDTGSQLSADVTDPSLAPHTSPKRVLDVNLSLVNQKCVDLECIGQRCKGDLETVCVP